MSEAISIVIDGVELSARAGQTILQAAEAAGIYIPRLCYHPELTPAGRCRVCTVLVNGRAQTACTLPVSSGMIVEFDTDELLDLRRSMIEMLFVSGNHFCMFCEKSGDCELQALAYRFGLTTPRYPYLYPEHEVDLSHPDVYLDRNRCILCGRCARASRELDGKGALGFIGRSAHTRIASGHGTLGSSGLAADDRAVGVCPVGSLMRKRIGFCVPVGQRRYDHRPIGSEIERRRTAPDATDDRQG